MKLRLRTPSSFLQRPQKTRRSSDEVAESPRVTDAIYGFHAQQAAEKLLKACLAVRSVQFRRTHDLDELLAVCQQSGEPVPRSLADIGLLTSFGVQFRYEAWPESEEPLDRRKCRRSLADLRIWAEGIVDRFRSGP